MKLTKFASLLMIGLALTFVATGCAKKPPPLTPLPAYTGGSHDDSGIVVPPGGPFSGEPTVTPQANPRDFETYSHDTGIFKNDTVYFAYDSSVIRSSEKTKIARVADYLKTNPSNGLKIEGHCDERGTDQYNLALGERRALAVREELIGLGCDGARILTESFGRSRPVDTGHSEAAHARNRRGEFILLTP